MRGFVLADVVGVLKASVNIFLTQVSQSCPNATIALCFVRILQRQGNACFRGPHVLYFVIMWNGLNWKEGKELALFAICGVHVLWVNET